MRSQELAAWRDRGRMHEIFGRRVFVVDTGPRDADAILVLHGFPTCSLDFAKALPRLAERHRVILHDHLGFGLSEKPVDYSYSLFEQAEVAIAVWRSLGIARGHLVGHDYGTSVVTEVLAKRERGGLPLDVRSVTLSNGSVLRELAVLRVTQHLLRSPTVGPIVASLSTARFFRRQIRALLGRPEVVTDGELDALFEAVTLEDGRARLVDLSRYHDERVRFRTRWLGALKWLDIPLHLLWGRRDPIARPIIPETLAREVPGAALTWLEDLGHYPMLEGPDAWVSALIARLGAADRST